MFLNLVYVHTFMRNLPRYSHEKDFFRLHLIPQQGRHQNFFALYFLYSNLLEFQLPEKQVKALQKENEALKSSRQSLSDQLDQIKSDFHRHFEEGCCKVLSPDKEMPPTCDQFEAAYVANIEQQQVTVTTSLVTLTAGNHHHMEQMNQNEQHS